MDIYVVQSGDTIDAIADQYEISVEKLIRDNELTDPYNLVPGEDIVIVYPSQTYTILEGDTLEAIAASNNISLNELLRNNPFLADRNSVSPGEVLTISYNRTESIKTYGYATPFIDRQILRKTLPYLTYLSIFNYRIVENGDLAGTNDDMDIIELAKEYGAIPLMHLTTTTILGKSDIEFTYKILLNEELQNRAVDNVLNTLREKGYYGINISAQYITSENQIFFRNFTQKISERLQQEGFFAIILVNPKIYKLENEVYYENIDYASISALINSIVFMQYSWGISEFPPSPIFSISNLNVFFEYVLPQVEPEKIITGIPVIGYMWELPYVTDFSRNSSIDLGNAINQARVSGVAIQFDEESQTPYFTFEDIRGNNIQYIVCFVNARTINSLLNLLLSKGITGTGVWNIMIYFAHLWLVMNSQYHIVKLLPEF